MVIKSAFIRFKLFFVLTAIAGCAVIYLVGKKGITTVPSYAYFAGFAAVLFIIHYLSVSKALSDCRNCSDKLNLELEEDDIVHDPDEPVYSLIRKIQDLKGREKSLAGKYDEYRLKKDLYSRELDQLREKLESASLVSGALRNSRNDIDTIARSLAGFRDSYSEHEKGINSVAVKQVGSIEDLSEVIRALVDSIDKESEIASRAEKMSKEMSNTVRSGGEDITKTITLISEVEKLSLKINEIIAVIDNISEQTNLLAMNAAIEAAHAGDAGKGFSVVAGEIQKLSRETNQSSRKISELVKSVSQTVKIMTENAQNASTGLKAIMESVKRTESIVADITGAINEQSEGGNKIMSAAGSLYKSAAQMKETTDRNVNTINRFSEMLEKIMTVNTLLENDIEKLTSSIDSTREGINRLTGGDNTEA